MTTTIERAEETKKLGMTLEILAEEIELQYLMKGCETCTVHECFNKNGECIYELTHLTMELDGEFVCCDDEDHILQQRRSVMMVFLRSSIKSLKYGLDKQTDVFKARIEFPDGYVEIVSK